MGPLPLPVLAVVDDRPLACAWLGDHAVDLWVGPDGRWRCGNDDRSIVAFAPDADAALDAYLAALAIEREVLGAHCRLPGEA